MEKGEERMMWRGQVGEGEWR